MFFEKSIDILKDAAATAIYGSRGANGVVIITTKRGTKNSNNISYSASYGNQKAGKTLSVLNGPQWADLFDDLYNATPNIQAGLANNSFCDVRVCQFNSFFGQLNSLELVR